MILGAVVVVVLGLSLTWILIRGEDVPESVRQLEVGETIPDIEAQTLDGEIVRFRNFQGQPLVINFWASWCTPCKREFPMFLEMQQQHEFTLLGVVFQDSPQAVRKFVEEFGAEWMMLEDRDGILASTFGVKAPPGIPQTVFIDAQGRLIDHAYGEINREGFESRLEKVQPTS